MIILHVYIYIYIYLVASLYYYVSHHIINFTHFQCSSLTDQNCQIERALLIIAKLLTLSMGLLYVYLAI